ncbi:MAG: Holliday junction resolvase RuvX [Lachnospiraceae bacterium]|nr:Holliday junction resolvase RuvX [Lachnospiraceae bacterium]
MRLMGLDFGSKTVGVAVSDLLGITAQPIEIVRRDKENQLRKTLQRIETLIKEYEISLIVLGLPKNMNDTSGDRVAKTMEFKEMLERRTGLEVELMDERLTTVQAESIMSLSGVKKKDYKEHVDELAAAIILQTYMDANNN